MAEEKTKKAKRSSTTKSIGYIVGIICFTALLILGSIRIFTMYQDMQEMKSEIEELNELKESINQKNVILPSGDSQKKEEESAEDFSQQQSDSNVYVTQGLDAKDTLDFIENEVSRYREFIEKQQQFLIWLVGIVATGALSLLGFLGFKSKSDIESIIEEEYRTKIDEKVSEITAKEINEKCPEIATKSFDTYIGGSDKTKYLKVNIEREEKAKNKTIHFLRSDKKLPPQAEIVSDKLESLEYNINVEDINLEHDKVNEIIKKINNLDAENDLIVLIVDDLELKSNWKERYRSERKAKYGEKWKEEFEKEWKSANCKTEDEYLNREFAKRDEELCYYKISKICEEKDIYCVLYAAGANELTNKCYTHFYTQMANTGLALLERILFLLNLS